MFKCHFPCDKKGEREGGGVNSVRMYAIENFDVKTSGTNILLIEKKAEVFFGRKQASQRMGQWDGLADARLRA